MKNHFYIFSLLFSLSLSFVHAQYNVYTEDITNFWEAYDSVQTTTNKNKQIEFLQKLYVDRGTVGLKEFMELRGGTPERWQVFINDDKQRFERVRPYTLSVLEQKVMIDKSLEKFKNIYPEFRDGDIFFTIGIGNSGGTVKDNHVLIGCEVMANDRPDWAVQIVMHEFVHTQQLHPTSGHLLAQVLHEGMADFISELVIDKTIAELHPGGHIAFAQNNEAALWKKFKQYIFSNDDYKYHGWLYDGITVNKVRMNDLGYGMGYLICKRFYENASDKKAAIKEMLTTNFTDEKAREFLLKSGFIPAKDRKFVQNFEFKTVPPQEGKKFKKVQYGYKVKNDVVEFRLNAKEVDFDINTVSVAGNFNNWNPKATDYQMTQEGKAYVLRIPKSDFEKEKKYYFKFVVNKNNWLQAPAKAKNVENDGGGNINLFLAL